MVDAVATSVVESGEVSWPITAEKILKRLTEAAAAAILVVEMGVISAGVVSRYVFHRPIFWTDELASLLFVWLSMVGSVVALLRHEHMRLSTLVARLPAVWQKRTGAFGYLCVAAASLLLLSPAYHHFEAQQVVTMPSLGIPESARAGAVVVGVVLLCLVAVMRLVTTVEKRELVFAVLAAVVVVGGLWLAKPWLIGLGTANLVFFFVVMLGGLILMGVPIAFTFVICTGLYLLLTTRTPLLIMVSRMEEGMSSIVLLAIPLFVFLGLLIEVAGQIGRAHV
jgi:TRAP-type C4-dicarboxylate transport system permease small subunit